MTCIVGLKVGTTIWMGGDSIGACTYYKEKRSHPKVFINNGFLIGYTTSFRMGQILQYRFSPSRIDHWEKSIITHMVKNFIPELIECLERNRFLKKSEEEIAGGTFLVGYKGELFSIRDDFQVGQTLDDYCACGSGEQLALGSLYASSCLRTDPKTRIRLALSAAEKFSTTVSRPFTIECLE